MESNEQILTHATTAIAYSSKQSAFEGHLIARKAHPLEMSMPKHVLMRCNLKTTLICVPCQ